MRKCCWVCVIHCISGIQEVVLNVPENVGDLFLVRETQEGIYVAVVVLILIVHYLPSFQGVAF